MTSLAETVLAATLADIEAAAARIAGDAIRTPALPFPATMTLQGLIETGNGQVRITNALVISTY